MPRPIETGAMYGYVSSPKESSKPSNQEIAHQINKDGFSLGDLNPLIHPVPLTRKESVDAIKHVTTEMIKNTDGIMPVSMESTLVVVPSSPPKSGQRFVARFEVPQLDSQQMELLEQLTKRTYKEAVRTRTDSKGNDIPTESYPPTQPGEEYKSKTAGWYMGPDLSPTSPLHQGIYVYKDLGQITKDNFLETETRATKYIVEVREEDMYQTDLVSVITQISSILGKKGLKQDGDLVYESYYKLLRLGLKDVDAGSLYGMEKHLDMIYRGLITPLASKDLSRGINQEPESVLMVGVPGTGKTLMTEVLLHEDNGIFILPIDPVELQKELLLDKKKQTILPRIAEVSSMTGKPVVVHIDDIENMVGDEEKTQSTMLNLTAGIKENGFYMLASTNNPEKIDPALLQPQRFGILIYTGLQNEDARYHILDIHANKESKKLGLPLFDDEEVREIVLREVAHRTDAVTPRYLAEIVTVAKSFLLDRIARERGTRVGLTEDHLQGFAFSVNDWGKAIDEVLSRYDKTSVKNRDEELQRFVQKHNSKRIGFGSENGSATNGFEQTVYKRLAESGKSDKAAMDNRM